MAACVFLYAFDLIELNGDDLRREPLEGRKAALTKLLARAGHGVQLNEHLEAEGPLTGSSALDGLTLRLEPQARAALLPRAHSRVLNGLLEFACIGGLPADHFGVFPFAAGASLSRRFSTRSAAAYS
jgi:hypothetical protein